MSGLNEKPKYGVSDVEAEALGSRSSGDVVGQINSGNVDGLRRHLGNRQIQLIAIGGSIGTASFVTIGTGLYQGGPGSLFIAYVFYSCIIGLVNNSMAEMAVLQPVSGGFVRMAGHWVDDALGFAAGWNFFFYEAVLIPFEITALQTVLTYWTDKIPPGVVIAVCIFLYGCINILAVRSFGEAEFWLSGGKVILIFMLFAFTFVTMCGGNPQRDAYGFRYWSDPGSFAEHRSTGSLGRFEGFLAALWNASFTVVGPEYIAMAAAEVKRPTNYLKNAFKTAYVRFALFFIVGALCVGIVCPWNEPSLAAIVSGNGAGKGTAAASPYVIAMKNLGITVLPDITNALMMTSIFSAGNTYTYAATRNLYGLALDGRAPKFLGKTWRNGVPFNSFCLVMCFPFLSFLQLSSGSAKVLTWLINLITAGGIINFIIMSITYLYFYRACKAQGIDRNSFPYKGYFQPYSAWISLVVEVLVVCCYGYSCFKPFSIDLFLTYYALVIIAPILFVFWKVLHKTKPVKPMDVDLVWERPAIEAYERTFVNQPIGFWTEMGQVIGIRRNLKEEQKFD